MGTKEMDGQVVVKASFFSTKSTAPQSAQKIAQQIIEENANITTQKETMPLYQRQASPVSPKYSRLNEKGQGELAALFNADNFQHNLIGSYQNLLKNSETSSIVAVNPHSCTTSHIFKPFAA